MASAFITLDTDNALRSEELQAEYRSILPEADAAHESLYTGDRPGSDFLGWVTLPSSITEASLTEIEAAVRPLREECDYVVSVGIGGSYLGIRAVYDGVRDSFSDLKPSDGPRLLFAGNQVSEDYMAELLELLRGHKFGIINISKSGTTTEPSIAFRLLKALLEEQEGVDFARKHIIAITDATKGALRKLSEEEGYATFVIPDPVGGRFTILTPVGLVPLAAAGCDIRALVRGAQDMEAHIGREVTGEANMAVRYAATRNALYRHGKVLEILSDFNPRFHYIGEWWKQLFAESEGKEGRGIFPTLADFTTDLHSIGQMIQQGERNLFETFVSIERSRRSVVVPEDKGDLDGLNYLSGKAIDFVNKNAETGTMLAHMDGGVPVLRLVLPELNEYFIGQLFYFFEKSVGISGYILGVNPFNQPGVEAYKRNMFALLGKPGYEADTRQIRSRYEPVSSRKR